MATEAKQARDDADEVIDLAEEAADGTIPTDREKLEELREEASGAAGRTMLREAPYAAIGLGKAVTAAAREVDTSSLPERLRGAPTTIASRANALGTKAKVAYLALAARGHAARAESAVADTTAEGADAAQRGVDEATAGADAAGGRAKAWLGKVKGAATRTSKRAKDTSTSTAASEGSGTDDLDEQTVAELRERASALDIEGRASMRKQELIESIRAAE